MDALIARLGGKWMKWKWMKKKKIPKFPCFEVLIEEMENSLSCLGVKLRENETGKGEYSLFFILLKFQTLSSHIIGRNWKELY